MKKLTLLTLLLLTALFASACGASGGMPECTDPIGCVEIGPDENIRLAYMLTISGGTAFLGEDSRGGIEIAIDDRGGSLLGHRLELVGEDSGCSAEGGQTAAQALATDTKIVGIIGSSCSSEAVAGLPIISNAGLLMISPSNTAPRLTDPNEAWLPGYYRTAHNDLFQGRVAAEFAYNELGARTVATIHDGSPYADQLQIVFANTIEELGGTVTAREAINVGDTDMTAILTKIAAGSPDVLYFPIFTPEGPFIVAQAANIPGLENTVLMGADGLLAENFAPDSGPNAVGMYLSGPYVQGAAYEAFLAKWRTKYGGSPPSGFHAFAYDGTNMLLDAIASVAKQGDDGSLSIGRQALRDALSATANFNGLTGSLTCGQHGDCATGQALGIFEITEAEVNGNFPPTAIWTP